MCDLQRKEQISLPPCQNILRAIEKDHQVPPPAMYSYPLSPVASPKGTCIDGDAKHAGECSSQCSSPPDSNVFDSAQTDVNSDPSRSSTPMIQPSGTGRQGVSQMSQMVDSNLQTASKVEPTPTIVHYRPGGVPIARRAKRTASGPDGGRGKRGRKSSGELEIRMVKWDRSDKGTAPLNIQGRSDGPRACTLCSITKRKVPFPAFLSASISDMCVL